MDINKFVKLVAEQFEDTESSVFMEATDLKSLEEWSSLSALMIIGMVDEEFGVTLKGDDINRISTVRELYDLIVSKK